MALHYLLGKMRNTNKERILMLGTSQVLKDKTKVFLSMAFPTISSPRHFRDIKYLTPTPMATRKQALDVHTEFSGLMPASFALEEFNKIKKTKLKLVRVPGVWIKPQGYPHDPCRCLYFVIMEAVDVDGVTRVYEARVQLHDSTEAMCLELFYRCYTYPDRVMYQKGLLRRENKLYHFLDNFYDTLHPKRELAWLHGDGDGDGDGD